MTDVAAETGAAAPPHHHAPPAVPSPSSSPPDPDLAARETSASSPSPPRLGAELRAAPQDGGLDDVRLAESSSGDAPVDDTSGSPRTSPMDGGDWEKSEGERDEERNSVERRERESTPDATGEDSVEHDVKRPDALDQPRSESSFEDPFAELDVVSTMDLFDVSNYTFGIKNVQTRCKLMLSTSKSELYDHLRTTYNKRGIRRAVGAVILVHNHRFPHILLLQRKDGRGEFVLPGGRLRPGESNEDGLQRKLVSKLTPSSTPKEDEEDDDTGRPDVGEKLCSWYAIDFDRRYFPYVPAHVTKPKEELHIYAVSLPSKFTFAVPNNLQLLAVPIFDVFNNSATYGDVISSIPSVLSKYHFNYC